MINSLAPMTFALVAAVSPSDAGVLEAGRSSTLAPPAICETAKLRAPCRPVAPPQGAPPQGGEKQAPEKSDARKKSGAGEQMRRYVDERAPRIADWLFDSPEEAPGYEGEPLRNRGLRSLPPVAGEHRMSNGLTVLNDIGFVIAGAEPRIVYVVSLLPVAIGSPVDVRPNDVIVSLNGVSIDTPQTFRNRYFRLRGGQPIELVLRRGEQRVTVAFYKPSPEQRHERAGPAVDRPAYIIPD